MKRNSLTLAVLALLSLLAIPLSAEGAGGMFFQVVRPEWNPDFLPGARMPYNLEYFGGYGYGVSQDGVIVGGFGCGFVDSGLLSPVPDTGEKHLAGGVGGMIMGARIVGASVIHLDLAARLGAGGIGYHDPSAGFQDMGYAILYAEPYAELGIGFAPWMHLSATGGYALMANFVPGEAFSDFINSSPTFGFTLSFGSFERPW
jgi:hypothetical protein